MTRQILPRPSPGKDRLRTTRLDPLARRAITHKHQSDIPRNTGHPAKRIAEQTQILLGSKATHTQHDKRVIIRFPGSPQLPAPDDLQAFKTAELQGSGQCTRRHHRAGCLIVEAAQVSKNRPLQKPNPIVAAVSVEIGSKLGNDRNAHAQCRLQR
jgi:hypothetical protein